MELPGCIETCNCEQWLTNTMRLIRDMHAMFFLEKGQGTAYMTVELVNEGASPVVQLHALVGPCKGAPHAIVDDHKVLVLLQQSRTCAQPRTFSVKDIHMASTYCCLHAT